MCSIVSEKKGYKRGPKIVTERKSDLTYHPDYFDAHETLLSWKWHGLTL